MFVSAHDSAATHALLDHARRRSTGRLTISASEPHEVSVWLLDGAPVGARSPDDSTAIIERLTRQGHLSAPRSRQLLGMAQSTAAARLQHDPILALLADEMDGPTFERVLRERFEENVCRFVGAAAPPAWSEGELPWCDNVQTSLVTSALIERCLLDWDLSRALDERRMLVAGPLAGESDAERAAQTAVGRSRATIGDIVSQIDLEPVAARVAVLRMIDRGVLSDPPGEFFQRPERAPWTPTRGPAHEPWSAVPLDASLPQHHPTPVAAMPAPVPDEELEGFAGALDHGRGGGASDAYTTPAHRLDRVDLHEADRDNDPGFAAPTLGDREVVAKIEVANDVLQQLCRAIDLARGPSRGASVLQLLVDARPRQFAPLVEGVKLGHTGGLPIQVLLVNLRRRPGGEQRRLLNDCLLDLLDRALDKTADELPDDVLDSLLPRVVGYRARLGL